MKLTVRPLTDRAFINAAPRERSKFTASWSNIMSLLEREVYALQSPSMDDPVLMVDCTERDIRMDGQLRADARLATNAVAIAFESRRGPLVFRADRYDARPYSREGMQVLWQHNVRAIALTLESLRAVDRYGATRSGEQYVGYRQIEAKSPDLTPDEARRVLVAHFGSSFPHAAADKDLVRIGRRESHPDRPGGNREMWDLVERAALALGLS